VANEQKIIFIVDDNNGNLIACKNILKPYYDVYPAQSAEKMFELLEHIIPDLILLDVEMPDVNGYDMTRKLKNNDKYKNIPIIFLSARSDAASEMEGFSIGALDYIHKPFFRNLLLRRIEMHFSLIAYREILSEIKNPVNEINKMLDEASSVDDPAKLPDHIANLNKCAKQLLGKIDNILDMSKTWDKNAGGQ